MEDKLNKKLTVKEIAALQRKASDRRLSGLFVAEGRRAVTDILRAAALSSFVLVEAVYATGEYLSEFGAELKELRRDPIITVNERDFARMSDTKNPQGLLALVRQPVWRDEDIFAEDGFVLALDGVSDPGNMGTIFRTAYAAGVNGLVLSGNCVDPYNPKVVRSTMSMIVRVPFITVDDLASCLQERKKSGWRVMVTAPDAKAEYTAADFSGKLCAVIGNEANGVSEEVYGTADQKIAIPMEQGAESLNAAVAAALIMYERRRRCHPERSQGS